MNEKQYHDYLDRLNLEYQEYMLQLSRMSSQEIFEKAGEIFAMKQTHDYLRSTEMPDVELEYAMTALHPMGSRWQASTKRFNPCCGRITPLP